MKIKNMIKIKLLSALLLLQLVCLHDAGFAKDNRESYHYPSDPKVLQTLKNWQDMKFGLFMHWGTYSQWGIVESWSLCPEDRPFTSVRPHDKNYFEYVKSYENLITTFNPVKFNPDKWAQAAKAAGMKYVVFTTKHHDGFNMFDTRQTDYKITAKSCPFHAAPRANVAKEIFNSFRKEGFMAGAYYSITDWHNNDFWWDYFPPMNRNINYSPAQYPEKWTNLNNFIFNQLGELTSGEYGKLGLLWFDLCVISKDCSPDWDRFAAMVRTNQPGIIMVARHTSGPYENYRTPEQEVPDKVLDYPWETCMTMGNSWSYKPKDQYKTTHELVQLLVKIVSRGGNFLLNIGPSPEGDFDPVAYDRLNGIGAWMKINGEAIYGTKPIAPFHENKMVFTQKDGKVYAFYLPDEGEIKIPAKIIIGSMKPVEGSRVFLLGYDKPLHWETSGTGFAVDVPKELQTNPTCRDAWTLQFEVR